MIIKLSKAELKTLSALDPEVKGSRPWQTAREVGGGVFSKKPENLSQGEIRTVRNGFRKLIRENLVEMNAKARGQYRVTDRGRKLLVAEATEFVGMFERGKATKAALAAGQARLKARPKLTKKAPVRKTTKKAAKKAAKKTSKKAAKKAPVKKTAKIAKTAKKAAKKSVSRSVSATTFSPPTTARKTKPEVVDKTKEKSAKSAKPADGNGTHEKPKFKRRQALKYANSQHATEE